MQTYGQLICELVDKAMSSLSIGTRFSAPRLAQEVSLEVILKVVFGIDLEDRFNHLKLLLVCNESLRLFPVATLTVPGEVKDFVELMGYQLEPGIRIYSQI